LLKIIYSDTHIPIYDVFLKLLTQRELKKRKRIIVDPNYLKVDEEGKKEKYSCRGIQKTQNEINKDRFHGVLFNDVKDECVNKGFRVINKKIVKK